ncbi:MAG: hypothetical protein ACTS44_00440 [Candidatus Hodgkinia cicadicola]
MFSQSSEYPRPSLTILHNHEGRHNRWTNLQTLIIFQTILLRTAAIVNISQRRLKWSI